MAKEYKIKHIPSSECIDTPAVIAAFVASEATGGWKLFGFQIHPVPNMVMWLFEKGTN